MAGADQTGRQVTILTPKGSGPIELGDLRIDTVLNRPYVPPTPEKLTADAFSRGAASPPRTQKDNLLIEARREYTRPLLLVGRPADPACIDLFRAFEEEAEKSSAAGTAKQGPSPPSELRWEFELASLNKDQPGVPQFAKELGLDLGPAQDAAPLLVVLGVDGSAAASYPLRLDRAGKLDRRALATFLLEQKLASRDAERMLASAIVKAKDENKRLFLIFSASWCGPCRSLARLLETQKAELERHYFLSSSTSAVTSTRNRSGSGTRKARTAGFPGMRSWTRQAKC